ncbi:uncharacterized protein LOC116843811 isoform X2 [Odontomachus brunneus]|uniref:uncharacterized protein LOC116843811 isoform X2 n=1 Tax=Odontomachus brunneus TaxID=486640 RepID=UPI0013F19BDF|nr:uncharacterized protein LOC116843811 isoform X2 [Odontomachus brunneus]
MNEHLVSETATRWCSAPGCMMNIKIAKRHYFRFPKERKRWMEWIKACNRMDLVMIGPEYANRYYRLCHLHFRVEMFRNIEGRIYLNKEAVPSIFLKPLPVSNNDASTHLVQPISFVTIFLRPESRNSLSKDVSEVTKELEISQTPTSDEKDTPIISSLQALFPKASIKQVHEKRNMSTTQATVIEIKSESNDENISGNSMVETRAITDVCKDSAISSSWIVSKEDCNNICTSAGPSSSTTLQNATSVLAITENDIKTPTKTHWHVSTQTPSIDFLVGKRRMEEPEIHIDTPVTKRKKEVLSTENEDYRANMSRFKATCTDLLPRNSALLVSACIDARERGKAMRHNFEGKQFALELFLMAPAAYRFYRPLCLLPTVRQLWRHVRDWDIPTGISDNVLNALHLKMKSLPPVERRCCLCVNQMLLRSHLFYNLSRDRIIGFDDTGSKKRRTLAKKALVMIVRSLAGDWEQPIAYYFQEDTCNVNIVKNLIFLAITKLKSIGVTVHALVTGMAPIFLHLSRRLGIFAEHPSFLVDGERVFYVFDVGRLIRATRNILMKHELHFREKRASWVDIELFFRSDNQMRLPLVPKLSVAHLEPNKYQKTETKYAVQVFSSTLAAGLSAYTVSGGFPLKAIGTVELLRNFDQLFDILNSSTPTKSNSKDFSQAFTGSTHEMCFLQRMLDFLKSIRVIDKNSGCVKSTGCFNRWQITINAVMQLWSVLRDHQLPFLRTRQLNQECVERIFRSIRRQSGNRVLPTPILFTRAFKNLVSKHLLEHSCNEDLAGKARRMLKRIATSSPSTLSSSSRTSQQTLAPAIQIALYVTSTNYRNIDPRPPEKVALKHVCEYLLDECSRAHNCDVCIAYVREAKEFPEGAPNSFSAYVYALENVFMSNFADLATEENLGTRILQLVQEVNYKPPCPEFPVSLLLKLYLRIRIYITLSRHNKICKEGAESCKVLSVAQL